MALTTVLFDLDGTLLPMDQEPFVKGYFSLLARKIAPLGYAPEQLFKVLWAGVSAMVKNDGSCINEEAFWKAFCAVYGERALADKPVFDEFYRREFQQAKECCGYDPRAAQVVARLKEKGYRLALATNPLFPPEATHSRIRWAGLAPEDFELVTTYDNSRFCKPNPAYYEEIMGKLGVSAQECLMVGNDVTEDMMTRDMGMQVFLLTPCLINKGDQDISAYPQGGFDELLAYIEGMPDAGEYGSCAPEKAML